MPRSERFSGVAAMPFDCSSFEALLSVTTRLVAKMDHNVADLERGQRCLRSARNSPAGRPADLFLLGTKWHPGKRYA